MNGGGVKGLLGFSLLSWFFCLLWTLFFSFQSKHFLLKNPEVTSGLWRFFMISRHFLPKDSPLRKAQRAYPESRVVRGANNARV